MSVECPGTQASPPAIKEVRSIGRTIACPGTQASPPAIEIVSLAKVAIKNDRAKFCPIKSVIRVHLSGIGVRKETIN